MVSLVTGDPENIVNVDEEEREKLQRELDFSGEFGEVRKSGISASANRLISESKLPNPLKFVKLFNQIDEDEQAMSSSDYEREAGKASPRKKQKPNTSTPTKISPDTEDTSSSDEPQAKPKESSALPKLIKLQDDSLIDDDTLEEITPLEFLGNTIRTEKDVTITIDQEGDENKYSLDELQTELNGKSRKEEMNRDRGEEKKETSTEAGQDVQQAKEEVNVNREAVDAETQEEEEEHDEDDEFFDANDKPQDPEASPMPVDQTDSIKSSGISSNAERTIEPEATEAIIDEASSTDLSKVTDSQILKLKTKLYSKLTGRSNLIPHSLDSRYQELYKLLEATIRDRESHSALIIGTKNSGKTTCLDIALKTLRSQVRSKKDEFLLIKLSGLIQVNDKAAVKSIARQLDSEISRVYQVNVKELDPEELLSRKSVTEAFSNILNILDKQVLLEDELTGKIHIPIVFVIDEVEVYANSNRQTLLYNLFDLVENSSTPITTVCLSTKATVKDSLEKRVRSRFSQRMIQFTRLSSDEFFDATGKILSIDEPENNYEIEWNLHVEDLISKPSCIRSVILTNGLTVKNFKEFHNHCVFPISKVSLKQPFLNDKDFEKYNSNNNKSAWRNVINKLPEIELLLIISAARLVIKNDLNWINLNATYEEYQRQSKAQNKDRSLNVFNTSMINTGPKIWSKERCEAPWRSLQRQGLLTPPTNAGKSGKTMDFSNNTVETKMWQAEVTLDELRLIVESDKNVKSWMRL